MVEGETGRGGLDITIFSGRPKLMAPYKFEWKGI